MLHCRDATWQCESSIHFLTRIGFHIGHTWIYFALPQCKASSQGCATYQCFSSIPSSTSTWFHICHTFGCDFIMWLFNSFFDSNMFPHWSHLICLNVSFNQLIVQSNILFLCLRFGLMLFNLCAGMVKQRTCFTNYAPLWANMKFLHDNFRLTQFSAIF